MGGLTGGESVLGWTEFLMVSGSILVLFAIGWIFGRRKQSTNDFFLGRRRIPGWAVVFSFVATEISAATVIGFPHMTFVENWQYVQFLVGGVAARIAIAFLFIPAFYRFDCTTIYEYLRHRFGALTQRNAAGLFFITRLMASGVRLMAASVAVSILLDWPIIPVIALFTVVSVVYIALGGIKAVIWTNVFQAFLFIAAGAATLWFLLGSIEGGLPEALYTADSAGRLDMWHWRPGPGEGSLLKRFFSDPNIVWIAVLNGFFGSMAAFGTDHEMMQRLLTVKTRRQSQRTMLWTIAGSFLVTAIFMAVGTGLFVFYQQHPELALPAQAKEIYPHFAVQVMPAFLRGMVLVAILMASIDSPLASLSASFVTDLYRPLSSRKRPDRHYVWVSRAAVVVFGLILAVIAYAFSSHKEIIWLAFKIGGVTYGSMLGIFLLGLLTGVKADRANVVSMTLMALVNLVLLIMIEKGTLALGWSWLLLLGTFGTMGLSCVLAPFLDRRRRPRA